MIFSKQIADLKALVTSTEGKLTAALGNAEALLQEKVGLEARVAELEAAQTDAIPKAAHDEAIRLKDEAFGQLKTKFEALENSVDQKVIEGIAAAGVPAVKRDPAAVDNPTKTAPASGLTPQQRLAASTKIAGGSSK